MIFLALSAHGADANPSTTPTAQPNDNRVAAGELKRGVLNLQLELVQATWYPDKDGGPNLSVYAFAEKGKLPQIPGPAIRVPQGTEVHVELHNTLPVAMFVRGFRTPEPVAIAPGGTTQVRFMATSPGSFYYSARSCKMSIREVGLLPITEDLTMGEGPFAIESQLEGAIVVDPPGKTPSDRIFVITAWVAGVITPPFREKLAINGKSWPDSERLSARVGQAESWRLINTSVSDHAMHLHGFYFEVKSVGGQDEDHAYAPDDIPRAVTKHLDPGETAFISWTPERPGRWLLHCHMTAHMMPPVSPTDVAESPSHPSHVTAENPSGMGGLVLGITVLPGPGPAVAAASNVTPRQLKLLVREVPATRFSLARMGYLIQDGDAKDTADPPPIPGAPLVLTRGEPTEITVVNQLHEQTSVHWHGIELESYYDGVPNWGGDSLQMTPPIPPGGTFVARMTPPRAGTFIYHTHWHDVAQLTSGLYGPIIVVEPGQKFDPTVDKIFIISREGPDESGLPLLVNGSAQPAPLVLKVGTKYRLRFINIGTNDSDAVVELLSDAKRVPWRAVAKDGWTLPPHQATLRPATQPITVGETYDFEFAPDHAGELSLQVTMPFLKTRVSQAVVIH